MSGALEAARAKGARACREGKSIEDNPYGDSRTYRGSVTFARAFWRAWRNGFQTEEANATQCKD